MPQYIENISEGVFLQDHFSVYDCMYFERLQKNSKNTIAKK